MRDPYDVARLRAGAISLVGIALLGTKYAAYLLTGSAAVLSDALESIVNVAPGAFVGADRFGLVRHAAGGLLDEEDTALLARLVAAFDAQRAHGIIRIHRLRAIRAG